MTLSPGTWIALLHDDEAPEVCRVIEADDRRNHLSAWSERDGHFQTTLTMFPIEVLS